MKARQLLCIASLTIVILMSGSDLLFAWSWPWKWDWPKKNANSAVATGYAKGTRTDMVPQVNVPTMPPPSIMKAMPDEPWQMKFLPDYDKEYMTSAIADNIAVRIDVYSGKGVRKPDLSIYHYENLTPELRKVQDKAIDKRYGKSWEGLSQFAKADFNMMLEQKGEYAENKLVKRMAANAKAIFTLEMESQKPDLEIWTRAKIAEKFTFGLSTVDPETGQIVNKYNSVYDAYGGFLIDNIASFAGLDGLGPKIVTKAVSKTYDKAVIPENEEKAEAKKMYAMFEKVGNEAGKQIKEVDISGYRFARKSQIMQPVKPLHVADSYVKSSLTGKSNGIRSCISANTAVLQNLINFTSQVQAAQDRASYQSRLNTNSISLANFTHDPTLDTMGYSLYSDALRAKNYLDNGEIDKYNAMVPIVNQKSKRYWGAMQNDKNYLAASQAQCLRITGSGLPSDAPQLPYALNDN